MSMVVKDCSPSKTITVKNLTKIEDEEARLFRLRSIAKTNIQNTQRLFYHNNAHEIKIYRLTSKLIPLATHPLTQNWDWFNAIKDDLKALGDYAKEKNFRISAHPDHYTLLNSPKDEVLQASLKDLEYHYRIFEGMELDTSAKLILHIGGRYKSKDESIERFINNFSTLPDYLKKIIILENDDKTYTTKDVLDICEKINIPMVLDIHHHWCNNNGEDLSDYIASIFNTWNYEDISPKIHISSPRSEKSFRSHADNIDVNTFLKFLEKAKKVDRDFDVMIEAKNKDLALFNLMKDFDKIPKIKIINQASIEY